MIANAEAATSRASNCTTLYKRNQYVAGTASTIMLHTLAPRNTVNSGSKSSILRIIEENSRRRSVAAATIRTTSCHAAECDARNSECIGRRRVGGLLASSRASKQMRSMLPGKYACLLHHEQHKHERWESLYQCEYYSVYDNVFSYMNPKPSVDRPEKVPQVPCVAGIVKNWRKWMKKI